MSQSLKIFPYKNNNIVNVKGNRLINIATPADANDVVTKGYVTNSLGSAIDLSALKSRAIVANNQTITHADQESTDYTCVKVNSETTSSFALTPIANGVDRLGYAIYARNGKVYVGGNFTNYFAVWDIATQTWSTLGAPFGLGSTVTRIVVDSNDNVYVQIASNLYKYTASTTTWTLVTLPFSMSLINLYSMTIDLNDLVYLPMISSFGGNKTLYTYDGTTFTSIANLSGMVPSVYSYNPNLISIDNAGTIYIAGTFGLRKLDGSSWVTVGDQFNTSGGSISNIVFNSNNDVYVGSTDSTEIKYYDGSSWSTLGSSSQTILSYYSMTNNADGNILIVKGSYVYILDVSTNTISTYYSNLNETYDMCSFMNGFLYISGNFVDGAYVRHVASLGTTSTTTNKTATVNPPSGYTFVNINNNSTTYSNIPFTFIGEQWKVLHSSTDDTYYVIPAPA